MNDVLIKGRLLGYLLAILLVGSATFAQAQAPVVWGEGRWLGLLDGGNPSSYAVAPMGDTLVFAATTYLFPSGFRAIVSHSYDNGVTVTPWDTLGSYQNAIWFVRVTASGGRSYLWWTNYSSSSWYARSTNAGASWGTIITLSNDIVFGGFALGQDVIAVSAEADTLTHMRALVSTNSGNSWNWNQPIDTLHLQTFDHCIAETYSYVLALATEYGELNDRKIYLARRDRSGSEWIGFELLPNQPYTPYFLRSFSIAADTASETAVVLSIWDEGWGFTPADVWTTRTEDGGDTWSPPMPMTTGARIVVPAFSAVFTNGQWWAAAWREAADPIDSSGVFWRFSANHGRNWYPSQRADDAYLSVYAVCGQFMNNEARLYWQGYTDTTGSQWDYRTVSGTVHPDTTNPVVSPVTLPSDGIDVGDSAYFVVHCDDNDTTSHVNLVIFREGGPLSVVPMIQTLNRTWYVHWMVLDTGYYSYHIEAEDFWENQGLLPDTGTFHFATEGWSSAEFANIVPDDWSISIYPNPFNSDLTLEYRLDYPGQVTLEIYDILGRRIVTLESGMEESGTHRAVWHPERQASGLYFARVATGNSSRMVKVMLLK